MSTNQTLTNLLAALTPKRYASGKRYRFDHARVWRHNVPRWRRPLKFVFSVQFGPGAGYVKWNDDRSAVLVHGRTFYFAWRSDSRSWAKRFRPGTVGWFRNHFPVEVALTQNAKTPYLSKY